MKDPALSVRAMPNVRGFMAAYRDAIGAEAMHAAYGPHWPRPRLHGEDWFEFRDLADQALLGWGSLLYDPAERVMWHSHGIFPAYQARGVTRPLSRWLRNYAFEHSVCEAVGCKILDTNSRFQVWMKNKNPNRYWEYAGHIALPRPGYDVYMFSRQSWQSTEGGS